MSGPLAPLVALWRNAVAGMLQYRGEIALWALWGIIFPAVTLAMWSAAVAGSQQPTIGGFGPPELAAYFLVTMVVGHFSTAWDAYEMGYLVRTGRMSPLLLLPILPLWSSLSQNLAYKFVTLAILVPIWAAVAWIAQPRFETDAAQLALGLVAMTLASFLSYLWGYNLALVAFWSTRVDALAELWFGGSMLFGGRLAPLALLPVPLQLLAHWMPFKWMIWFPVEVLIGRIPATEAALGLLAQLGWLLCALVVFRWMWHAALRRYAAVGA